MCTVADRYVFIFHGLPSNVTPNYQNSIEFIDLGNFDMPSTKQKWENVVVQNNEFIISQPQASALVSNKEIIIFGGLGNFTFNFDVSSVVN